MRKDAKMHWVSAMTVSRIARGAQNFRGGHAIGQVAFRQPDS